MPAKNILQVEPNSKQLLLVMIGKPARDFYKFAYESRKKYKHIAEMLKTGAGK